MASKWREAWRAAARTTAEQLGLETSDNGDLTGSVEGLPLRVFVHVRATEVSTPVSTMFDVLLPGWPSASGLKLWPGRRRFRRWPRFRNRYVQFDDDDWDNAFTVMAHEPGTVRRHLDRERRAAITAHTDAVREAGPVATGEHYWLTSGEVITVQGTQSLYRIEQGLLRSSINGVVTSPDVIIDVINKMVVLAKAITGVEVDQPED